MPGHVSDFFQKLSIKLDVEVSEDYYHPTMTMMRFAVPGAKVVSVKPDFVGRYTGDDIVDLTEAEWNTKAYDLPEITLTNHVTRTFRAAGGHLQCASWWMPSVLSRRRTESILIGSRV